MNKINWCKEQKNGLELINPNANLANAYLKKAEESLETAKLAKSKDWIISASYYTFYFSLYCIMMKMGVKCEIHSCSIAFAKHFLKDYLNVDFLEDALQARIDAQYYVDRTVKDEIVELMIQKAPLFLVECKEVMNKLTENEINKIRSELNDY